MRHVHVCLYERRTDTVSTQRPADEVVVSSWRFVRVSGVRWRQTRQNAVIAASLRQHHSVSTRLLLASAAAAGAAAGANWWRCWIVSNERLSRFISVGDELTTWRTEFYRSRLDLLSRTRSLGCAPQYSTVSNCSYLQALSEKKQLIQETITWPHATSACKSWDRMALYYCNSL